MKFTFYGHACFLLDTGKEKLLFDPFLSGNDLAAIKADQVESDYILLSHAHADHLGDAPSIAERTGAKVIAIPEIIGQFPETVTNFQPMNLGGIYKAPFGSLKMVTAMHSSGVPGGIAAGFIIKFNEGITVYYSGDTALFGDMKLFGELFDIDYAVLPVGDNYTMGPEDALIATRLLKAKTMIPLHYNTWPIIAQNPQDLKERAAKENVSIKIINPGESIEL